MRSLLITGNTGFVGRAAVQVLQCDPHPLHWRPVALPDHFDIRSPSLVEHVAAIRPDAVLHLAALTSVVDSFLDPTEFFDVNFNGTWNVLRALRASTFAGRLLFVGSGDCYGAVREDELPIVETQPLRPRSPYAVSKLAAEALCYQWSQTESFDIVMARAFNHFGPGQDARFAIASFARQIARIRNGRSSPHIITGDLSVTRDLTDVRDVISAYIVLLEKGRPGEAYNVASGCERRLSNVLDEMLAIADVDVEVVVDPAHVRAGEQRRAVADVHKIASDTGWAATIPLARSLADVLDDWNQRVNLE